MKLFTTKKYSGFTLIELLITSAIIMIVVAGSLVAFLGFQERQKALVAAKSIQQLMRSAQVKARVRDTPTGCASLTGYRVQVGFTESTMQAVCAGVLHGQVRTVHYSDGVSLEAGAGNYMFRTLEGGVTSNIDAPPVLPIPIDDSNISLKSGGATHNFSVTKTGAISNVTTSVGAEPEPGEPAPEPPDEEPLPPVPPPAGGGGVPGPETEPEPPAM